MSAQTHCAFDELDVDALPNQIVKSTLRLLGTASELDADLRNDIAGLYHSLGGISDITLTRSAFGRVQLHRNIGSYRLLLQVCRFVYEQMLPDEAGAHAPVPRLRSRRRSDGRTVPKVRAELLQA